MKRLIIAILFCFSTSVLANDIQEALSSLVDLNYSKWKKGDKNTVDWSGLDDIKKTPPELLNEMYTNIIKYNASYLYKYVRIQMPIRDIEHYKNSILIPALFDKKVVLEPNEISDRVLKLKRGDNIDMVCIGRSHLEKLVFSNCQFTDDFADKVYKLYVEHFNNNFPKGNYLYLVDSLWLINKKIWEKTNVCKNGCSLETVADFFKNINKDQFAKISKSATKEIDEIKFGKLPYLPMPPMPQNPSVFE